MLGPLITLRIKATICPCLTAPKESTANEAATALSNLPIQFCIGQSSESGSKGVGNFVTNLFKSATNVVAVSDGKIFIRGRLKVIDSIQGPTLRFEAEDSSSTSSNENNLECDNDNGHVSNESRDCEPDNKNATIPLGRIGDVEPYASFLASSNVGLIIYKKKKNGSTRNEDGGKVELIRFHILSSSTFDDDDAQIAGADIRDDILDQLNMLLEWDRERRKSQPTDDEDEEDDDQTTGNGLTQRALKAKYFFQKEIEMKKQAKDRESRKARYMKDSGGLKYTALAMANREIS